MRSAITGEGFCFDNEMSRHKVYLQDFEIASKLVKNFEFVKFVNDGGYRDHRLWHSEGLDWVKQNAIDAPLHWHFQNNEWHQFTLGGLRKLDYDAPVCHISFYEAAAFAEWREMRLPTEFEWEALHLASNAQNCVGFWGSAPDPDGGAYDAPPYPLVVRGFLPSAIAASRLRRSQFPLPHSDILVCQNPPPS